MPKDTYESYKDARGEWRWRYFGSNGEQISKSSEGYKNKSDSDNAIQIMKGSAKSTEKTVRKNKPKTTKKPKKK